MTTPTAAPSSAAATFDLLLRKPGRPWHVAARAKAQEVAVITGEQMRAEYGYEYEVRPTTQVST